MPIFSMELQPCWRSATTLRTVARISTVISVGQQGISILGSFLGLNPPGFAGSRPLPTKNSTIFCLRLWQSLSFFMSSTLWLQASVISRCVDWDLRLSRSSPPMWCMAQLLQSTRQMMLMSPQDMRQQTLPRQPPARQQQKCIFLSVSLRVSLRSSTILPSSAELSCSSFFWKGLTRFISSYSEQILLNIFLLQRSSRRFSSSSCRFSGEQRMIGCVVQKIFGFSPSYEMRKGQAPEYSSAEWEMSTNLRSLSSWAASRYFLKSKLWLMPQSSMILYFYSMMRRQQLAPSSCSDSSFFTKSFIYNYSNQSEGIQPKWVGFRKVLLLASYSMIMFERNCCEEGGDNCSGETGQKAVSRALKGSSNKSSVKLSYPVEDDEAESAERERGSHISVQGKESLGKFCRFVGFHGIEAGQIWEGGRSMQYWVFADLVYKKFGYKFSSEETIELKKLGDDDKLSAHSFSELGLWKGSKPMKPYLLSTASSYKAIPTMKRSSKASTLGRKSQEESMVKEFKRSGGADKTRMRTTCDRITRTFLKSGFVNEESKDNKIESLREDLQMNALEKKWELVVMAGQMNKWIHDAQPEGDKQNEKSPALFKIINLRESFSIVRVDQKGQQQVIPEVVFFKKYSALKKKQPASKQVQPRAINQAILGLACIQPKGQANKTNLRDRQLNQALLHIMRIKNVLQHQHKLLSQSAINT